jgi:hypothetical protein
MKKQELLELIRQVVKEEQDYQDLFKAMLDKTRMIDEKPSIRFFFTII